GTGVAGAALNVGWAIQSSPNPTGTQPNFKGVSCTPGPACMAVGVYTNGSGTAVTLAERWNGNSWSIKPPLNPAGAKFSVLFGVSFTSGTACTAVGQYVNSSGTSLTLAERWNGNTNTWAIQPTPNATGATNGTLKGVS